MPLFLLANWKKIAVGLLVAAVVAMFSAAVYSYNSIIAENNRLSDTVGKLNAAHSIQNQTIDAQREALRQWAENQAKQQELLHQLQEQKAQAEAGARRLNALLSEKSLEDRLAEDPAETLELINFLNANSMRMLECATSSGSAECTDGNHEAE